jgi:hypothetical protein
MNFLTTYNSALQVTAAFLIFVAGYLALFLCMMICLVIARFILEGTKVARAHLGRPALATVASRLKLKLWTIERKASLFTGA